jgi:hypothetical protein
VLICDVGGSAAALLARWRRRSRTAEARLLFEVCDGLEAALDRLDSLEPTAFTAL